MLKIIPVLLIVTGLIACNNQNTNQKPAGQPVDTINYSPDKNALVFDKFKNTKWIVGEIGLNGEQPDTIIFQQKDTLAYISTDTGKELCFYSFFKDTLIFKSHFSKGDINLEEDKECESINRLHYESETFRYIYFDEKCTGDKQTKRFRMDTLNVKFRRI